jgi:phospho-2-dehydro-3-deoxyheptonate aldolase
VSVTDACIDWATTEQLLRDIATTVGPVLEDRNRVERSA